MPNWHRLSGMDIRHVRTFVTVAEHGTVSAAAGMLHVTQPALSRQIVSLEQEFGFKLFARSGRRLLLTPQGEELLADCRNLLSHVGALTEQAQTLRRGELRVLKIATSSLTIEGFFPGFLHFWEAHVPDVRIALTEADSDRQLEMVERGEAHLAISVINAFKVDERRFATHLLPLFYALAAHAAGAKIKPADRMDIRQLVEHPLLVPSVVYATRSIFDAACRVAGLRPTIMVESGTGHALLALAQAGHGVAVIPSILAPASPSMRWSIITHRRRPLGIELAVVWDRRRPLPRQAETFTRLLHEYVERTFVAGPSATRSTRPRRSGRTPAPRRIATSRSARSLTPWT
jgi:DNA-binding transcriptional LysR family regulator